MWKTVAISPSRQRMNWILLSPYPAILCQPRYRVQHTVGCGCAASPCGLCVSVLGRHIEFTNSRILLV